MVDDGSILGTGAAGQLGSVGRTVTGLLLDRGFPVRAMVRREDERAASLRAAGAQVVVGDLLEPGDVYRVVSGCSRVYFSMSPSAGYLEATVTMAAVAREAAAGRSWTGDRMGESSARPGKRRDRTAPPGAAPTEHTCGRAVTTTSDSRVRYSQSVGRAYHHWPRSQGTSAHATGRSRFQFETRRRP